MQHGVLRASLLELHCMECRRVQPFEQPQCLDGHDEDCPEWVCVSCGCAVFTTVSQVLETEPADFRLRRSA